MADAASAAIAALITVIPFYLALLLYKIKFLAGRTQTLVALAFGMSLLFFLDPLHDTNGVGLYSSSFGLSELILISAFAVTFIALALGGSGEKTWPLWTIATGIALHSFAESSELVDAVPVYIGNFGLALPNAASFVLHKFLEGFVLFAYSATAGTTRLRQLALGASPMLIFALTGAASSLFLPVDLTPVIAAGAGGWALVLFSLGSQSTNRDIRIVASVAVGFVIVYSLGLLHSAQIG